MLRICLVALTSATHGGCAPSARPVAAAPPAANAPGSEEQQQASDAQGSRPRAASAPAPLAIAPAGFVIASVEGVLPTPQGNALLLVDPTRTRVVPVMIGESEATVIDLRLRGERFDRPLTHDLLDALVRELGGTIVMVQVDKLRTGVFIGSVVVWDGERTHRIDARTSDAVAVALGHDAPIYVSSGVFDEAGLDAAEMLAR
jgi:bifunctional DNase/RNase